MLDVVSEAASLRGLSDRNGHVVSTGTGVGALTAKRFSLERRSNAVRFGNPVD